MSALLAPLEFGSERNVVVREVVRERLRLGGRSALALGLATLRRRWPLGPVATAGITLATAEHLHFVADDVGRVVLDTVLFVRPVFEAAFDVHLPALAQVFARDLAELAEQLDPVPFGLFLRVAVAVLAHRRGGQAQRGDGHAALGVFHIGIVAEIADQDDLVDATSHCGSFMFPTADRGRHHWIIAGGPLPSGTGRPAAQENPSAATPYNRSPRRLPSPMNSAPLPPPALSLSAIQALAVDDMARVDALIRTRLASDVVLINQVGEYIIGAGGKRLRPMLLLLAARALGHHGEDAHQLAAVVEFIHTATLLHDDVVDESDLRRGRRTANAVWGNAASVLVGDFLYSRSFQLMVELDRMDVMRLLADTTNRIAEGEVLQLLHVRNPDTDEAAYLRVIERKTAVLFAAATRLGAMLAGADARTCDALEDYGLQLGYAFQIADDVLDYAAEADALGKNLGDDLAEGKATLPLIHAIRHADASTQAALRHAIEHGD